MGTRGFVGFFVNGELKATYNHSDSYPDGLGLDVLRWLRKAHEAGSRRLAGNLRAVDSDSKPTADDIERLTPYANTRVSTGQLDEWYVLLRGTQGNPAAMLDAGVIEDAGDWPAQGEYGYVVDFDGRQFEAYEGYQKEPHDKGRFAHLTHPREGRYPIALKASWSFDSLPTDDVFIDAFADEDES